MSDGTDAMDVAAQESVNDKKKSEQILNELDAGSRSYPDWFFEEYTEERVDALEADDDISAIDPETLGKWD